MGTLGNIKNEELGTMFILYDENGCGYMNLKGVEIELYPDYFTVVYGIIKLIEVFLLATEVLSKIDSQYNHFCVIGEHRIAQDILTITKGVDKNVSMGEIGKYVGTGLFNAPPSGLELEFDFHANVVVVGIVYHMLLVSTKGGKATLSKDAHIPYGSHHRFSTITQPRNSHNSINAHILFQPVLVCGNQLNIQDMPSLWLPRSFSEYANSPWPQIVQLVDVSVWVAAVLDSCAPKLWYKLGFIIEYHFDGAACFVSALVQELEKFGDACLFHEKQFIQWDPSGCFIVHVEVATIILHHFLDFNLEDKVCLHRGDSDMIHVVWIPCVLAWMIDNEGTINDIKAVEIMEKIKHKKIARLQYCFIVLDGSLVAKLVAFGVTKIVTYGCQFMHIIVRICGYTSQVKMERRKKWDPRRHGNMHTTTWSTKFKQWDTGKIGAVSNCYNLEDKVGFKGGDIVMNPPYWIGPNRS
ncbi:unnamed protein product [Trifolium pratense]|uniref:Uncharacterized protein n=1 Tax=Trifolium pratense TaxID=57577 RepID=A0ACB0LJY1_TRIPR|nr:unnamed protein product [Trifolium pratense]